MKVSMNQKKMPRNSFSETGFYFSEHLRYTGKWGLVWHNIPEKNLPKPYKSTTTLNGVFFAKNSGGMRPENIEGILFSFPSYLIEQIGTSFSKFPKNFFTLYNGKGSFSKDLLSVPLALADFLPAALGGVVTALSPIVMPFYLFHLVSKAGFNDFGSLILCTVFLGPFAAAFGLMHAALTTSLMLIKASLETTFSLLTVASIPFKALGSLFYMPYKARHSKSNENGVEPSSEPSQLNEDAVDPPPSYQEVVSQQHNSDVVSHPSGPPPSYQEVVGQQYNSDAAPNPSGPPPSYQEVVSQQHNNDATSHRSAPSSRDYQQHHRFHPPGEITDDRSLEEVSGEGRLQCGFRQSSGF